MAVLCAVVVLVVTLLSGTLITASSAPGISGEAIGVDQAKAIALKHAALTESQVTFLRAYYDRDDGRAVYDVEFYYGNIEYDYEIDAITGSIREFDRDIENYTVAHPQTIAQDQPAKQPSSQPAAQSNPVDAAPSTGTAYISEEDAKAIALKHAELTEAQVTFIKAHLDRDDGRDVYDIEFYHGNTEYDYEIDALTGDIREFDRDIENYTLPKQQSSQQSNQTSGQAQNSAAQSTTQEYIGEAKAKSIALNHAGLSESQVSRLRIELDRDDGIMMYEIEFKNGRMEYEYEINATSGVIHKADAEHDDD